MTEMCNHSLLIRIEKTELSTEMTEQPSVQASGSRMQCEASDVTILYIGLLIVI